MASNEKKIDNCRVVVEDGEVRITLSEEILKSGYIPLETARRLSIARIKAIIANEILNRKY